MSDTSRGSFDLYEPRSDGKATLGWKSTRKSCQPCATLEMVKVNMKCRLETTSVCEDAFQAFLGRRINTEDHRNTEGGPGGRADGGVVGLSQPVMQDL